VALATPTPVAAGAKLHSGARAATRADKRSICCGELLFSDDCDDVTAIGPVSLGGAVVVSSFVDYTWRHRLKLWFRTDRMDRQEIRWKRPVWRRPFWRELGFGNKKHYSTLN